MFARLDSIAPPQSEILAAGK